MQTDRQIYRQIDRYTDRYTDGQICRQTDMQIEYLKFSNNQKKNKERNH